ncbi:S8 family serine peptidase [bacterium]|nr:S8 family serine peptidase [bacterium]
MNFRSKVHRNVAGQARSCHRPERSRLRFTRNSTIEVLESRLVLSASIDSMADVARQILVEYEPASNVQVRAANRYNGNLAIVRESNDAIRGLLGYGSMEVVRVSPGESLEGAMDWLSRQPGVRFAEPNRTAAPAAISDDPDYVDGGLWGVYGSDSPEPVGPSGTTNVYGTAAETLWNQGVTGSDSVYVGIVDEGVDINHPDLVHNIWVNPYDPPDGRDNDGNGYVDDVNGWDFSAGDNSVYDGISDDHGTHVAGIIAAEGGNGQGVAGVGWNTKLIVAKFMGASGGTLDGALAALDYLTDLKIRHGIDIVASNNSWIGGGYSQAMHEAILRSAAADILFVAAAGNYGVDNDSYMPFPSSFSSLTGTDAMPAATYESVIAVAAIDANGALPSYSSYGASTVDIAAPGSGIRSTLPGGTYGSNTGTSMATASVTGAIALLKAAHPGASAWRLKAALYESAIPTASLTGKVSTGGRSNVYEASRSSVWDLPANLPTAVIDDATIVEGQSGSRTMRFTVRLSNATDVPVTCDWSTADGTAQAGADYTAASGTVEIPAGETQGVIEIEVFGDRLLEDAETFDVRLNSVTNAYAEKNIAAGMITNDDYSPPVVSVADVSALEGNNDRGVLAFVVTLGSAVPEDLSFDYFTTDGTATAGLDYVATTGRLTIPAGQTDGSILVRILGDKLIEENETLELRISLTDPWFTISRDQALGTILDDDAKGAKGGGHGKP